MVFIFLFSFSDLFYSYGLFFSDVLGEGIEVHGEKILLIPKGVILKASSIII